MLATLVTLGLISGGLRVAASIKRHRVQKREFSQSYTSAETRFEDLRERNVVVLHLALTPENEQTLAPLGGVLEPFILEKEEALAVLAKRTQEAE